MCLSSSQVLAFGQAAVRLERSQKREDERSLSKRKSPLCLDPFVYLCWSIVWSVFTLLVVFSRCMLRCISLFVYLGLTEIVRLLKSTGIYMQSRQSQINAEEETKRRLFAKYERQKRRQLEHNVLRKEMASHALPHLFVSRRSDRNLNGFNCAVCRRDVSFLSRGEPEIWRHFTSKGHFVKDRRYRLDHEDVLYTTRFDEVPVSSISAELCAEIEKTPAVVLGKKNPFVEDEVDALVGVVSNVPSSTLVGSLFELLRSGGSHRFLKRLWSQFQATLPVNSSCAQATWSKTETLVIIGQTLYPRILCRIQGWVKDSVFSVSLRDDQDGLRFYVHGFANGTLREVCVLWEPNLPGHCDSEILVCHGYLPFCLPISRLFACGVFRRLSSMW